MHFAWVRYQDKEIIKPKLQMFADGCGVPLLSRRRKYIVYVLSNFDTTLEQDLERVYFVRSLGFQPYIMLYNKQSADRIHKRLQRWVNNNYLFWACEKFEDFNPKIKKGSGKVEQQSFLPPYEG